MRSVQKFVVAMVFVLAVIYPASLVAQSCAMCRVTAKATPKEGQRAINRAILVMLFPPLGIMTLGVCLAMRYGKRRDQENDRTLG